MASNANLFLLWRTLAFVRSRTNSSCGMVFAEIDKDAELKAHGFFLTVSSIGNTTPRSSRFESILKPATHD